MNCFFTQRSTWISLLFSWVLKSIICKQSDKTVCLIKEIQRPWKLYKDKQTETHKVTASWVQTRFPKTWGCCMKCKCKNTTEDCYNDRVKADIEWSRKNLSRYLATVVNAAQDLWRKYVFRSMTFHIKKNNKNTLFQVRNLRCQANLKFE